MLNSEVEFVLRSLTFQGNRRRVSDKHIFKNFFFVRSAIPLVDPAPYVYLRVRSCRYNRDSLRFDVRQSTAHYYPSKKKKYCLKFSRP